MRSCEVLIDRLEKEGLAQATPNHEKKKSGFPQTITVGAVTGKIYRQKHKGASSGFVYTARTAGFEKQSTSLKVVTEELRLALSKIGAGRINTLGMTQSDSDELVAARRIVDGYPLLQALREWKKAHERRTANQDCKPISVSAAKKRFIDEGLNAGKQHDRTYGSALKSLVEAFPNRQLHTIETTELTTALAKFLDGVTRNSYRKKWRALFSWARKNKHLPKDKTLEIDDTQLAAENSPEVGIITPEVFAKVLMYMHDYHPHYLAATVLAGFCGMRSDEIHGKRVKSTKGGQLWRDIYTQADELNTFPFLQVSNAKNNTPAWRRTPLPPAAVEWLNLVPIGTRGEFVCQKFAIDRVREIAISAGLILPENAFRHSYITYACERTGNKNQVAIDAGTSVEKIDKYYRRPVPHALALQWNELTPDHCRKNFEAVRQKTPSENGAKGWIGSKSQRIAANENLRKGRKFSV